MGEEGPAGCARKSTKQEQAGGTSLSLVAVVALGYKHAVICCQQNYGIPGLGDRLNR